MQIPRERIEAPGRHLIANVPEGADALLLSHWVDAAPPSPILHVARDDARLARLRECLAFFAPEVEVLSFPAWDCLPYDRVSPHRDILANRLDALGRFLEPGRPEKPFLLLTTVNALIQRLPPRAAFDGRLLRVEQGQSLASDALLSFLTDNGYQRAETVREPGEFAVRGGIIDVFSPGDAEPLRLDFFGDEVDELRSFDALTQRSTGKRKEVTFGPVGEIILSDESIARFRSGYRETFGAVTGDDPLYEAISAGRVYAGMEHWLPLFYERLETLLDYVTPSLIVFDHQVEAVRDARLASIEDFYQARAQLGGKDYADGAAYKPLAADRLYLMTEDWDACLADRAVAQLQPFAAPPEMEGIQDAQGRLGQNFAAARGDQGMAVYDALGDYLSGIEDAGSRVIIAAYSDGSRDRLGHLLTEHGIEALVAVETWSEAEALPAGSRGLARLGLEQGFLADGLAVVSEQDILGDRIARPATRRRAADALSDAASLEAGDLVVHVDHGIGRYEALVALEVAGAPHDCLKVVYQGGDRLFVPVENIEVLSRYGSEDATAELDKLGGVAWQARRARIKKRIQRIAQELIKIAAARELKSSEPLLPPDGLYDEFCARFPYPETEDQLTAIADTVADLASGRPSDRLICGDVGFGKTEVALRAAFVAVMAGKQVAVVAPTTLLCRQHAQTFAQRFADLPVRVGQLSRLVSPRDAALVKQEIAAGTLDIAIGTHALLAKSINFRDLGLLVVDEEQHFGVKQKERLKQLREDVHVLTLTATPIPRTLQMAMSGVKEMSLIATPPVDRLAVRTFVLPYDPVIVREAILREHYRGGQTFYVCPRVADLPTVAERLAKLVPEVKVAQAHGQMTATALEAVMTAFYDGRYDVLLSTNIVESGLDIPTANTLVIHRSDMFGLAQLYQLRGRIGRSKQRGYAYLTLPPGRLLTAAAEKRLEVMQTLDTLGAGFTLASHDLDLRGAGNLVGEEQSGHIREVGIELYQQMLEEAVMAARRGGAEEAKATESFTPQIAIGTSVLIPEAYVKDLNLRLGLYRRLSSLVEPAEIEAFAAEMIDRFGPLPEEVENLLQIIAIKQLCRDAGVDKLEAGPKGAVVSFYKDNFTKPEALVAFIQRQGADAKLRPDMKLVYRRSWETPADRLSGARRLVEQLADLAK